MKLYEKARIWQNLEEKQEYGRCISGQY